MTYNLFCHKLSHLDKILSFLYALAKNQISKTENTLSVQKLKRKWKISHPKFSHDFSR